MKRTVLLVTNSPLTRKTLSGPLQQANYQVVLAENVRQVLGCLTARDPDLLIVDADWPPDHGWEDRELIETMLRANPCLPVILLTGQSDLRPAAETLGVRVLAGKPPDVLALMRTADELLREPMEERTQHLREQKAGFRRLLPNPEAFREALWRRASAPFHIAGPLRNWGLNE